MNEFLSQICLSMSVLLIFEKWSHRQMDLGVNNALQRWTQLGIMKITLKAWETIFKTQLKRKEL